MCWSVPGQILAVGTGSAVVDCRGRQVDAALLALDGPVRVGDWVLVHSGLVLARLTEAEAAAAASLQQQITDSEEPT